MKNRRQILDTLLDRIKNDTVTVFEKSAKRVYITIQPRSLCDVARYVFRELGARFNIASGIDMRRHIEVLYHFTFDEADLMVSFRVLLDKESLEIDSLAPLFKGANWIEREMHELLGIKFRGHPDMRRLLLPEEWPEGVYPLRADYREWDASAIRDRGIGETGEQKNNESEKEEKKK